MCREHSELGADFRRPSRSAALWRTPAVIVVCGCLISMIGFGPRSALGFFLTPMSAANGWGREVFALSVAMQTLLYGAAQPFSGAIADRFGTVRVIIVGTLLYAAGIFMMAHATTPGMLYLSTGVLIGFGLSGCSFNLVISSFGKLLPESWRSLAFGAGTAAGSFGQFLFSPLGVGLIDAFGWQTTLEIFAGLLLLIIPLAFAIATPALRCAAASGARRARCRPRPTGRRWPRRSATAPTSCSCSASSPAASSSASSPASAGLSDRPRPLRRDRRLDAGRDRAVQHRRRDAVGLARRPHAQALHPVLHLFRPRAGRVFLITLPASPVVTLDLRRRDRPALALVGAADLGPGRA